MKHFAIALGTLWIIAALWYESGQSEPLLWASLLPMVWLLSLGLFRI